MCLCYNVSSKLEANAVRSSSLHARFFSPCGRSCWAVVSARQSGPEWPLCAWVRERSTVVYVWPLSSAAGVLILQVHRTWLDLAGVCDKSEGCLAASIFTRFIIESILLRGETKCCSGANRFRGLETQPDNKLRVRREQVDRLLIQWVDS